MEHGDPAATMPKLTFFKYNHVLQLKAGTELLRIPHIYPAAPLKFGCCKGQCGTCAVKIAGGMKNLSPQTKEEQATLSRLHLSEEHRLACQCALLGDVDIE